MEMRKTVLDGKNKITLMALLIAICLIALPNVSRATEPNEVVSRAVDEVIEILGDASLKGDAHKVERRAKVRRAISKSFSFETMAKRAMGKYWKERTPKERKEFTLLFQRLIEISYISKIEGFTNEKVLYEKARTQKNISLVKTKIVTSKGTEIPINYRLIKRSGSDWVIYDIVIEGVSLVRNYRTQFSSVLRRKPYSTLVEQLRTKLENHS